MDGMALVQILKSGGASTFGHLADKHLDRVTAPFRQPGCNRVDVVFDRCDRVQSPSLGRGKGEMLIPLTGGKDCWPKHPCTKEMEQFHKL